LDWRMSLSWYLDEIEIKVRYNEERNKKRSEHFVTHAFIVTRWNKHWEWCVLISNWYLPIGVPNGVCLEDGSSLNTTPIMLCLLLKMEHTSHQMITSKKKKINTTYTCN
jgi:hypothetical protein